MSEPTAGSTVDSGRRSRWMCRSPHARCFSKTIRDPVSEVPVALHPLHAYKDVQKMQKEAKHSKPGHVRGDNIRSNPFYDLQSMTLAATVHSGGQFSGD